MAPDGENVASAEPCFWYDFVAGDGPVAVPVLVLDTRFRRGLEPGGAGRILNEEQWKRIQDWLGERPNGLDRYAPRFIVSGSVFAPGRLRFARDPASARRADSWQGYPEARARLAQLIAQAGVENVVFVSGDYHCAAVADLAIARPGGADIRAYAIVSPPLYAPFPFVNTRVHEIAAVEAIAFPPDHADGEKPIATCRAGALEINSGFALITCQKVAANGDADDWEVGVEFHAAAWDGSGKPTSKIVGTARLARGEATLLPPT
jgi:pimeloyl-ACP methyl ester carboxylesterase